MLEEKNREYKANAITLFGISLIFIVVIIVVIIIHYNADDTKKGNDGKTDKERGENTMYATAGVFGILGIISMIMSFNNIWKLKKIGESEQESRI